MIRVAWTRDAGGDGQAERVVYEGHSGQAAMRAYYWAIEALIKSLGRYGGWRVVLYQGVEVRSFLATAPVAVGGWASWSRERGETEERRRAREAWEAEVAAADERRAAPGCLGEAA